MLSEYKLINEEIAGNILSVLFWNILKKFTFARVI